MTPLRFGPASRKLYGVFHPAATRRTPPRAVLLCNPFGQEAVRTHRLYRLLAERLAREGVNVLRFDYHATGESDGDDEAGDLEGWRADVATADAELRRRSGAARCTWFGARLGGTLAAAAAVAADPRPARLVLWEPVTDGAAYLADMARSQARALHDPYGQGHARGPQEIAGEALGFGIGGPLRAQLAALRPEAFSTGDCPAVCITRPQAGSASRGSAQAVAREVVLPHNLVWDAEEAMNSALAPAEVVGALQQQLLDETPGETT